jgi:hypothetical protein
MVGNVACWPRATLSAGRTEFRIASNSRLRDNDVRFFIVRLSVVAKTIRKKNEARRFVP